MGCLGEAVPSETSIFLGCKGHKHGFLGVEEVVKATTAGENLLRMEIHNGRSVKFLFDLRHPLGRIIVITGEVGIQKLGILRSASICDVMRGNAWQIRNCRDPDLRSLVDQIKAFPIVLSTETEDTTIWKKDVDEFQGQFVAHNTWNMIRIHKVMQAWSSMVWFPQHVPRFAFIAGLAIKDRLATGHRMRRWSQGQVCVCIFYVEPDETRDHLFFACPYTFTLWIDVVGSLMSTPPDPDWSITLEQIAHQSQDRLTSILLRLVFLVTIYHIWRERNDRRYNNVLRVCSPVSAHC